MEFLSGRVYRDRSGHGVYYTVLSTTYLIDIYIFIELSTAMLCGVHNYALERTCSLPELTMLGCGLLSKHAPEGVKTLRNGCYWTVFVITGVRLRLSNQAWNLSSAACFSSVSFRFGNWD